MKPLVPSAARIVVGVLLFASFSPIVFSQEIPITSASKEAKNLFLKGREKSESIEIVAAAELYDKAIALDPNFALAYIYRSLSGGGFAVARQNRDKAVSLADKVTPGERHWILSIQANAESNRPASKEHLDELVKLFPRDKRVQTNMGFYFNGEQDYANALIHFNKALEIDKNFAGALNAVGYVHMATENWGEAEKVFKRQIEILPNSPNPYDSYAEMLLRNGRYDEAIANYQKAYEKSPTFINAFSGMGIAYCHKGDFAKAREGYQQQFDKAPNVSFKLTSRFNRVLSYLYEGNVNEAIKALQEYRALAQQEKQVPAEINSYAFAGWIHLENGNINEAARHFEMGRNLLMKSDLPANTKEGIELNQNMERSVVLTNVYEFDAARVFAEKAQQLVEKRKNPGEARVLSTNLALIERGQGNYDKAIELASKNPSDPYTWFQTGLAYELKGDRENAKKMMEKVVKWNWNSFPYALVRYRAKQKLM